MVELQVKLGPKGQIVIPQMFRKHFNMQLGKPVTLKETKEGVLITPVKDDLATTAQMISEKVRKYRGDKEFVYNKDEVYSEIEERGYP